jgi:transposase
MDGQGDGMYVAGGRDSVPPERLLKASLLMAFYTVLSERLFCEQWATTGFSVRPQHVLQKSGAMQHDVAKLFFGQVVAQAQQARLMSLEHFSVDGTLIDAYASLKSLKPARSVTPRFAC